MAIKPRQYCFRVEILPSQLICTFFEMQAEKTRVTLRDDIDGGIYGQDLYLSVSRRSNNYIMSNFALNARVYNSLGKEADH